MRPRTSRSTTSTESNEARLRAAGGDFRPAASGFLLLLAAIVALAFANSRFHTAYERAIHLPIALGAGKLGVDTSLQHAVNDGLMAIFFLVVGLEIKREFLTGELSGKGAALLPIVAACGGAAVPAFIYAAWNAGGPGSRGWGIPMATDIAFAVGVLALVGSRVPAAFRVFLTALAVVDDLLAVAVIAIFYTAGLDASALAFVAILLASLVALNASGTRALAPYLVLGFLMWAAMAKSGVHATVAGVLLGFAIPGDGGEVAPLRRLERALHPWVAFLIMPLFALSNAGVALEPGFVSNALGSPIGLGVIVGLFAGKQVGIVVSVLVLSWFGIGNLSGDRRGLQSLWGVSLLGGIGFTMSLFVTGLAFGSEPHFADTAKASILAGSLLSGLAGAAVLSRVPAAPVAAPPSGG